MTTKEVLLTTLAVSTPTTHKVNACVYDRHAETVGGFAWLTVQSYILSARWTPDRAAESKNTLDSQFYQCRSITTDILFDQHLFTQTMTSDRLLCPLVSRPSSFCISLNAISYRSHPSSPSQSAQKRGLLANHTDLLKITRVKVHHLARCYAEDGSEGERRCCQGYC